MKKLILSFLSITLFLFAETDHILISEIVISPTDGEYIKITNPTNNTVDLTDYYLTDATDTSTSSFYYNLPSGNNFHSGSSSDFTARFPAGYSINSGESVIIAIDETRYNNEYGEMPDLAIKSDFLNAVDGINSIGLAPTYLDNFSETIVLFYWDGTSDIVKDVDYILWGDKKCAVDKTGISTYLNDTPIDQQEFAPYHVEGKKLQRISNEGSETSSGGNGITGHDETSENLASSWQIVSIGNTKPQISNVNYTPSAPTTEDNIIFSVNVSDDGSVSSVEIIYTFDNEQQSASMTLDDGVYYSPNLGPFETVDTLFYYLKAVDDTGLKDSTNLAIIKITEPAPEITIRYIRDHWEVFNGKTVTLTGVVSIGSNVLRTDKTSAYMQDNSGSGINLFAYDPTELNRGDSIEVTGTLEEFNGVTELTNWDTDYTLLKTNAAVPNVPEIFIGALNEDPLSWEGSFININGIVAERADDIGGGSNVTIEDVSGRTTIRIWNTTNVLFNSLGEMVNPHMDSLLSLGYDFDATPYIDGDPGNEKTTLKTSPYPFVPQLGEQIQFEYEYPSNSRVILRIYDLAGRFITTLVDEYFALSYNKNGFWNGRDEFNRLVVPGTYLFHLETTNRTTGKTLTKVAPVVVGVKF